MIPMLAGIAGWRIWKHWRGLLIAAGVIVLIAIVVGTFRSCQRAKIKLDQETINKINSANEAERKKELRDRIEENAGVIATADNRSAIADVNVVERNRAIDEKVKAADAAIQEAKRQDGNVTQEELQCILVPENCS